MAVNGARSHVGKVDLHHVFVRIDCILWLRHGLETRTIACYRITRLARGFVGRRQTWHDLFHHNGLLWLNHLTRHSSIVSCRRIKLCHLLAQSLMIRMILCTLSLHIQRSLPPSFRRLPHLPVVARKLLLKFMPVSFPLIVIIPFVCPTSFLLAMSLPFLLKFFFKVLNSCLSPLAEGSLCFTVLLLSFGRGNISGWLAAGLWAGLECPFFRY